MISVELLVSLIVAAGGASGLAALLYVVPTIRRLRAEARKISAEAAAATSMADDAHFERIIRLQAEAIVAPLNDRVRTQDLLIGSQDVRISHLEGELVALRIRYRAALSLIRALYTWITKAAPAPEIAPPAAPEVLADDL